MNTKILFLTLLCAGILFNCDSYKPETKRYENQPITSEETFDGPPFADTCQCDFSEFGTYRIADNNYNIYKKGKGWNPKYYSCSWIWGEDVANTFPDDTTITLYKIHLLDLDEFAIPTNATEFGVDSLKNFVIATYTFDRIAGKETCVFDPFNTGKYPKPPQWTEN